MVHGIPNLTNTTDHLCFNYTIEWLTRMWLLVLFLWKFFIFLNIFLPDDLTQFHTSSISDKAEYQKTLLWRLADTNCWSAHKHYSHETPLYRSSNLQPIFTPIFQDVELVALYNSLSARNSTHTYTHTFNRYQTSSCGHPRGATPPMRICHAIKAKTAVADLPNHRLPRTIENRNILSRG